MSRSVFWINNLSNRLWRLSGFFLVYHFNQVFFLLSLSLSLSLSLFVRWFSLRSIFVFRFIYLFFSYITIYYKNDTQSSFCYLISVCLCISLFLWFVRSFVGSPFCGSSNLLCGCAQASARWQTDNRCLRAMANSANS